MDAKQFLTEFAHISNAPKGVQLLREMIYNLAITGDLTSRSPDDGDATDLLSAITAEKNKRIRAKKFKRSPKFEKTPLIVPRNVTLPEKWVWTQLVRLGEISPKNIATDDMACSFIPMSGFSQSHSGKLEPQDRVWGSVKKGFTQFADGDVVIAKITPCFENRKTAVIKGLTNGIGAGTTELHVVRPISGFVDPSYLYIYLRSPFFMDEGENNMTGTAGQKRLPAEYFATRAFPLPPLAEQKRIVAKVDKLMKHCDKLEAQQERRSKLGKLTRSTVLDAFSKSQNISEFKTAWQRVQNNLPLLFDGPEDVPKFVDLIYQLAVSGALIKDCSSQLSTEKLAAMRQQAYLLDCRSIKENGGKPPKLPDLKLVTSSKCPLNWHAMTLESACTFIIDCPHSTPIFTDSGYYCIDTNSIKPRKILWSKARKVTKKSYIDRIKRLKPKKGDLLFSREGTIGVAALVSDDNDLCLGQRMMIFRFAPFILPEFAEIFLLSGFFKAEYAPYVKGTAAKHLNIGDLRKLTVWVPTLDVQKELVEISNLLSKNCNYLEKQLSKAKNTASTLAKAAIASIVGTQIQGSEKVKAPKTELVSKLKLVVSPNNKDKAPLCSLLAKHDGELSSKVLWNYSGLEIDTFYRQLKTEMARGWIVESEKARMIEKDESAVTEGELG